MNPLEEAVMLTPWKTPSQYAAYINSIKKTHAVNRARREKELVRRTRLTAKSQTDVHLAEVEECRRLEHLEKLEGQRRMVTHLVRAATPQPLSSTRGAAASALQRRSATRLGDLPSAQVAEPRFLDKDVTSSVAQGRTQSVEQQQPRQPAVQSAPEVPRASRGQDRAKVETKAGHYVFEDEVGLIDIDEGESSSSSPSTVSFDDDDSEHQPDRSASAGQVGAASTSMGTPDDGAVTVDVDEHLLTDDALVTLLKMVDDEALEYLQGSLALSGPNDRGAKSGTANTTTSLVVRRRAHAGPVASTTASIAVFLSSLRPHALTAIRRIEESRRNTLYSNWLSERQEILGHFSRSVAANAAQESSTEKRVSMLIQQETALRSLIAAKRSSAVDRLRTEEDISRRKIERMERVRGRLNDKEDKAARDEARQKHLLDELAHKMLMRVMNDAKGDVDLMVDNTDAWAVNRKRNSSVAAPLNPDPRTKRLSTTGGGLLAGFYFNQTAEDKKRRRSTLISEELVRPPPSPSATGAAAALEANAAVSKSSMQPSVSAVWDSASSGLVMPAASPGGEQPYTGSKLTTRRASRKSSASVVPPPPLFSDLVTNQSVSYFSGTMDDKRRASEEEQDDDNAPWTAVQKDRSREERWRLEAKRVSRKLKHELLHECLPDFSAAYDKRTSESERPLSGSVTSGGAAPLTPQLQLHEYSAFAPTPMSPGLVPDLSGSHAPLDSEDVRNVRGISIVSPSSNSHLRAQSSSSNQRGGSHAAIARAREFHSGTEAEPQDTVVVDKDDNPIAAALRDLQEQVQQRNDERLTAYQKATAQNHLTSCIDKVVGGKIRRATVFTATAGLKLAPRRNEQSSNDGEYNVAANVAHTSYDLTSASDILSRVLSGIDSSALSTTTGSQRPMSPTKSGNARKQIGRVSSERSKANAMSFGTFGDHMLTIGDSSTTSVTLKRRKSSFFQVKRKVITDEVLVEPTIISPDPAEMQVPPPSRSSDRNPNQSNSHLSASPPFAGTRGSATAAGSAGVNLLRRKRSNVASLLVNSGLGRHNVEDTRKDAAGDTNLYLRLRGHHPQHKPGGLGGVAAGEALAAKDILGTVPDQLLSSSSNDSSDQERDVQSDESDAERMWTAPRADTHWQKPPALADLPELGVEEGGWSEPPPAAKVSSFASHSSTSGSVPRHHSSSPQRAAGPPTSGGLELPKLPSSAALHLGDRFTVACSGSQMKSALHLRRASRSLRTTSSTPSSPLPVDEWYIGPQDLS